MEINVYLVTTSEEEEEIKGQQLTRTANDIIRRRKTKRVRNARERTNKTTLIKGTDKNERKTN